MSVGRFVVSVTAVAAAIAFIALLPGAVSARGAGTLAIRVEARDFSFKLSRRAVPAGSSVRFVVRNRGTTTHDFVVKGRRTRTLRPGQSQAITIKFPRKGTYRFFCSVEGHARLGMKGSLGVATKPAPPPPPPPPVDTSDVAALAPIGTFERPVLVTAPPGDTQAVFVVEQTGTVQVVRGGEVLPRPFLDLRGQVTAAGESGLLAIAFAPDYQESGLVYAFYNLRGGYGDVRIAEFRRNSSDPDIVEPSTERAVLTIPKPYENHNGGMLQFGPDGYLYISVGDGDPGVLNPAGFFAQRLDDLLGGILRIDPRGAIPYAVPQDNPFVGVAGARPEIWAYGLRNPWRFWIDDESGSLIVGDVGSTSREEINVIPPGASGLNFGWPCFEGTLVFDSATTCVRPVSPLLEIPRENGVCALIGGVVSDDPRIPTLAGRYLYGDLCTGEITTIAIEGGAVTASGLLGLVVPGLTSFGVDSLRRVYATSGSGEVYRLDPKPAS